MNNRLLASLEKLALENQIEYRLDFPLSRLTTFRVGGKCAIIFWPKSSLETLTLESFLFSNNQQYLLIGGGSNLLIADEPYPNPVIQLNYHQEIKSEIESAGSRIFKVPASMLSSIFSRKVSEMGFKGAEFLSTIPGTLGGAIVQNAGCYGGEISQILILVEISEKGEMKTRNADALELSYRSSIFKNNKKITIHNAWFRLFPGDPESISRTISDQKLKRKSSQPQNKKNAGSVFKNPLNQKAWYYIQEAGLKGYHIGGAIVSPEHANFIVNSGSAKAEDIKLLIDLVRDKVKEKFNINLEPEIELIGFS